MTSIEKLLVDTIGTFSETGQEESQTFKEPDNAENMYDDFHYDISLDYIHHNSAIDKNIEIAKYMNFDSNVLFFEEDLQRPIEFMRKFKANDQCRRSTRILRESLCFMQCRKLKY